MVESRDSKDDREAQAILRTTFTVICLIAALTALTGCGGAGPTVATLVSTQTPTPTQTPVPTTRPSPSPTPTATPRPTATPAPQYVEYSVPPTICDDRLTAKGRLANGAAFSIGNTIPFIVVASTGLQYNPLSNTGGMWGIVEPTGPASWDDIVYADTGQPAWNVRQMYATVYTIDRTDQTFDIAAKAPSAVRQSPSSYVLGVWASKGRASVSGIEEIARTRIAEC